MCVWIGIGPPTIKMIESNSVHSKHRKDVIHSPFLVGNVADRLGRASLNDCERLPRTTVALTQVLKQWSWSDTHSYKQFNFTHKSGRFLCFFSPKILYAIWGKK